MSKALREEVEAALGNVIDPELGIDVVVLGLIYEICVERDSRVSVLMTLTTPVCPMHATIANDVEMAVRQLSWVTDVNLQLTFTPPWTPERLAPRARVLLES